MVLGVRTIDNELEVLFPESTSVPTDDELKNRIETVFLWNAELNEREIMVSVTEGFVSLQGSVDTYWTKMRAGDLAAALKGAVNVKNKLAVVPTENIVDKIIAENIVAALERNPLLDAEKVDVKVDDGTVILSGMVPNWMAHKATHNIAAHTNGVKEVRDHVVIGERSDPYA
jgi:osmotically-inducible protein OsmY